MDIDTVTKQYMYRAFRAGVETAVKYLEEAHEKGVSTKQIIGLLKDSLKFASIDEMNAETERLKNK